MKIVFRYIFKYDRACDVVNDGFVKLFSHMSSFAADDTANIEKTLMGWIRRIMINAAIDEWRRMQLVPHMLTIAENAWDIPDHSADPVQSLLYRDLILLLKQLPEQYRLVFNLYVIDGYGHQQIAESLNISVSASKSTLSRARALIQKLMKAEEQIVNVSR